jgi:hypothetical protein
MRVLIPGEASAPSDPPIKSAWRPPNMDMYSGCYINIMDIYIPEYIYISRILQVITCIPRDQWMIEINGDVLAQVKIASCLLNFI